MDKKYHYFYKITNKINNKYYYGVHSTNDLNDGYMGSGKLLHFAYEKYGIENFEKEILQFFDNDDDMFTYEMEIVNDVLLDDPLCYNLQKGGKYFNLNGRVTVTNNDKDYFVVSVNDKRYKNGELKHNWLGKHHTEESKNKTRLKMTPKDSKNNRVWVHKNGVVKYLRKDFLEKFLSEGWELGRIGYKPRKNCQGKLIKE